MPLRKGFCLFHRRDQEKQHNCHTTANAGSREIINSEANQSNNHYKSTKKKAPKSHPYKALDKHRSMPQTLIADRHINADRPCRGCAPSLHLTGIADFLLAVCRLETTGAQGRNNKPVSLNINCIYTICLPILPFLLLKLSVLLLKFTQYSDVLIQKRYDIGQIGEHLLQSTRKCGSRIGFSFFIVKIQNQSPKL